MALSDTDVAAINLARAKIEALNSKLTKINAVADAAIAQRQAAITSIQTQRDAELASVSAKIQTQQALIDGYADLV